MNRIQFEWLLFRFPATGRVILSMDVIEGKV